MPESLYKFMNQKIGLSSWDNSTFILFRRSDQIVRKYNALGLSTSILIDLIQKGCRLIVVKIDDQARYKISPKDWLEKGIIDKLSPHQDPHAFFPLNKFKEIGVDS